MSLAPYFYQPMTPPDATSRSSHSRNVSSSSYCVGDISLDVLPSNTISRSPVTRQHGPTLLPKIRTQDSCLDVSSAGRMQSHRRALSSTVNPPASGTARPMIYRCATEPVESTYLVSPISNPSFSRANSVQPSLGYKYPSAHKSLKTHSRSVSTSSIDTSILNRYGYPTYRQMPVYVAGHSQSPSPHLFATNYSQYSSMSLLDPPMITLDGTFETPIDLEAPSRTVSLSPPPMVPAVTDSLFSYLTQSTQPIQLVRHLNFPTGRGLCNHFWWDVRNLRTWDSFSFSEMSTIPDLLTLLNFQHDVNSFAQMPLNAPTANPSSESDLASLITKIYFPKVNAATGLSLGANAISLYAAPTADKINAPTFLANYANDGDHTLSGLPRGRVVGLVKSFNRWNTGMRREGPAKRVEYLKGLSHLQKCMRDHSCRYGFIITEIELVCVRAGCDESGRPYFGYLELSDTIATKTSLTGLDGDEVPMTVTLALYYLLMLAKSTPLPGQRGGFVDVGAAGALSRQRVWDGSDLDEDEQGKDGKDKWMPEPQMGEKREARTVRGWVWPSDPWHRRESGDRAGARRTKTSL